MNAAPNTMPNTAAGAATNAGTPEAGVRVSNEGGAAGGGGGSGAFAELFRLQSEFQARLAEETLRYLRRLQGAVVPAAPGTFVRPDGAAELRAAGAPGARVELALEVENLQRVHCMLAPQLTPLVSDAGVTWFPETEVGAASRLLAPGAVERVAVALAVPAELPPGEYRGALVLQGFRSSSLPVHVTVAAPDPPPPPATAAAEAPAKTAAKGASKAASKAARPARGRRKP